MDTQGERRRRWRHLLKLPPSSYTSDLVEFSTIDLPPHPDEEQVALDVDRSFTAISHHPQLMLGSTSVHMSYTTVWSPQEVRNLRNRLKTLVISLLRHHPCLHYYQGFHDVASIVLLVCPEGSSDGFDILQSLTTNYLRDFMLSGIGLTTAHLRLILVLLETIDPELFAVLAPLSGYDFFPAISSIITLFAHDLSSINQILRVWDFILETGTFLATQYVYVAALMEIRDDFLDQKDEDMIHSLASPAKLLQGADVEHIVDVARTLYDKNPLFCVKNVSRTFDVWFRQRNQHSVLVSPSIDVGELESTMAIQEEESCESAFYDSDDTMVSSSIDSSTQTLIPSALYSKFDGVKCTSFYYRVGFTVGFIGVMIHLLLKSSYVHEKFSEITTAWLRHLIPTTIKKSTSILNAVGLG
ncbi:hypothetical protein DICA3_E04434 [Diutina catenulata]